MLEYCWLFALLLRSARYFPGVEGKWTQLPPMLPPSSRILILFFFFLLSLMPCRILLLKPSHWPYNICCNSNIPDFIGKEQILFGSHPNEGSQKQEPRHHKAQQVSISGGICFLLLQGINSFVYLSTIVFF